MNVLSLFDGMSCGRIALERAGIKITKYYASEIEKSAIAISKKNYPDIIQLGDVKSIHITKYNDYTLIGPAKHIGNYSVNKIDLIIAGSPCQGFSQAGEGLAFDDERSKLFWEFVRILKEIRKLNPKVLFLLENVKMKQEHEDVISNALQCEPVHLNSNLVSAQNRKRVYWSNFFCNGFDPKDRGILLHDILEQKSDQPIHEVSKYNPINKLNYSQWDISGKGHKSQDQRAYYSNRKFGCLANARATTKRKLWLGSGLYRNLSWTECERLQTVPDGYTQNIKGVSEAQALSALGNGWTVDIIAHIFRHIPTVLALNRCAELLQSQFHPTD